MRSSNKFRKQIIIANTLGTAVNMPNNNMDFYFDIAYPLPAPPLPEKWQGGWDTRSINWANVTSYSFKPYKPEDTCVKSINLSAFVPILGHTYRLSITESHRGFDGYTIELQPRTLFYNITINAATTGTQLANQFAVAMATDHKGFLPQYDILSSVAVVLTPSYTTKLLATYSTVTNTTPVTIASLAGGVLQVERKLLNGGYIENGADFTWVIEDTTVESAKFIVPDNTAPVYAQYATQRKYYRGDGTYGIVHEAEIAYLPERYVNPLANPIIPRKALRTEELSAVVGVGYNTIHIYERMPMSPETEHINMPTYIPIVHEWYVENSVVNFTTQAVFDAYVKGLLPAATAGTLVGNIFAL